MAYLKSNYTHLCNIILSQNIYWILAFLLPPYCYGVLALVNPTQPTTQRQDPQGGAASCTGLRPPRSGWHAGRISETVPTGAQPAACSATPQKSHTPLPYAHCHGKAGSQQDWAAETHRGYDCYWQSQATVLEDTFCHEVLIINNVLATASDHGLTLGSHCPVDLLQLPAVKLANSSPIYPLSPTAWSTSKTPSCSRPSPGEKPCPPPCTCCLSLASRMILPDSWILTVTEVQEG